MARDWLITWMEQVKSQIKKPPILCHPLYMQRNHRCLNYFNMPV